MVGLRIPPKIQMTTFFDWNEKNEDQPMTELICFSI